MDHGPHHNCAMCRMVKAVGMMEKHPEGCDCQEKHEHKHEDESHEHTHAT